jgi:hypothetical protein
MFPFWVDPSSLSLCEVVASLGALITLVNSLFCRPA